MPKLTHSRIRIGHYTDIYFILEGLEINSNEICNLHEKLNIKNSPFTDGYFNVNATASNCAQIHFRIEAIKMKLINMNGILHFIKKRIF